MPLPSTMWTCLLQVRSDPERVKDLVVRRYRQPVVDFARAQGIPPEDAEDVAQEVFLRVCREEFLGKADRSKGRFRNLLLAVTRHVIASHRRHALAGARDRRREVALGDFDLPAEAPPDAEFDRLWVRNLVGRAMERLRPDPHFAALELQIGGKSYKEIAAALGRSEGDVTNHVHRAKLKLKAEIERLVGEYCTAEEMPEEIGALLRYL
ncbi:MAG: sigma-70 family RNA polymerase sigma factor [Planctomycetes bacterium]|nr:sigma-70 family RNA polymerase sigma factor [Planctomycetota bacterium]